MTFQATAKIHAVQISSGDLINPPRGHSALTSDFKVKRPCKWEIFEPRCAEGGTKAKTEEKQTEQTHNRLQCERLLCFEWIKTAPSVTSAGRGGDPAMPVITLALQNPYWNNESV